VPKWAGIVGYRKLSTKQILSTESVAKAGLKGLLSSVEKAE
jgi:hypothetical protein